MSAATFRAALWFALCVPLGYVLGTHWARLLKSGRMGVGGLLAVMVAQWAAIFAFGLLVLRTP